MLSANEQSILFGIARRAIELGLEGSLVSPDPTGLPEALLRPAGAFVTLTIGGELRGCIGSIFATVPLYRSVSDNAANAAFRDPRFSPLSKAEYPKVHLEISVMGPIEPVTDPESIVVGRDGLIIRRGQSAGLLLPQVPIEWNWDRDQFIAHTCRKAGLPSDAWRDPACSIEKFTAEVFAENQASK